MGAKFLFLIAFIFSSFTYSQETGLGWKVVTRDYGNGKYEFGMGVYRTEESCLAYAKLLEKRFNIKANYLKCVMVALTPEEIKSL